MKPVERIGELLNEPIGAKWFEMHHQYKLLKIEINKLQAELRRCHNDKTIMENHLNTTIKELSDSNEKIRKLRRKDLRENELKIKKEVSKLEQITSSMTSSMAYIDRDFVYRYINNKYTEWFGVEKDNIVNKKIAEVVGEQFFNMYKPVYEKVFSGESFTMEVDTHIANTTKRLVITATYVPAYDLDQNNIGAYIYGTDITQLKIKEEEKQASEKALAKSNEELKQYIESNVQLEQFAYVAAHDMKTPMRSIASFSELLLKSLSDTLTDKQKEYFDYITNGTKRLSLLVTDLLNYSKVGGQNIELSNTNLNTVLKQVTQYLSTSILEKKAEITIDRLPENISADKIKIYQVFQNLIANSLKFVENGKTPQVKVSCLELENFYEFSVKDNGIGIDEQFHKEVFESFKQVNNKDEYEGTGLGLSICKKIVEHHGGTIKLESAVGEGTNFIFTLPKG